MNLGARAALNWRTSATLKKTRATAGTRAAGGSSAPMAPAPLLARALVSLLGLVGCTVHDAGTSDDLGTDLAAAPDAASPPPLPSPWVPEHPQPTGNALRACWSSGGLAYAVGALGTVVRISDGAPAVTEAAGLTRADLNAVTAVGQEVWAVGDAGVVLHRSGGTWSRQQLGTAALYTVFADGAGGLYAAGQGEALWRYDGAAWSRTSLPGQTAGDASYAGAAQGELILLAGSSGRILRRDRSGWQRESDGLTPLPLRALLLRPDGSGYAVGDGGTVLRREAAAPSWSLDRAAQSPPPVVLRAVLSIAGEVYAVAATGLTLRRTGSGWQPSGGAVAGQLLGASGDDSGAFAVGVAGQLWRRGPAASDLWRSALPVSLLTTSDLTAVADAGDGSLYAVSEDGLVLRRTASGAWSIDGRAPGPQPLYSIWAQGEEAYAVGSGGVVLQRRTIGNWQPVRYTYPDSRVDFRGVWAFGAPREVVVVGTAVNNLGEQVAAILHGTPALDLWEPEKPDTAVPEPLYAVAGSSGLLIAVGSSGTVLRRSGGRWGREGSELGSDVQLVSVTPLGSAADADFYATGSRGALLFRDGKKSPAAWTRTAPFETPGALTLGGAGVLGDGLWVVGTGGLVGYRGPSGRWLAEPTPTAANLRGLASSGGTLFAVGQGGLILRRSPGPPPRP